MKLGIFKYNETYIGINSTYIKKIITNNGLSKPPIDSNNFMGLIEDNEDVYPVFSLHQGCLIDNFSQILILEIEHKYFGLLINNFENIVDIDHSSITSIETNSNLAQWESSFIWDDNNNRYIVNILDFSHLISNSAIIFSKPKQNIKVQKSIINQNKLFFKFNGINYAITSEKIASIIPFKDLEDIQFKDNYLLGFSYWLNFKIPIVHLSVFLKDIKTNNQDFSNIIIFNINDKHIGFPINEILTIGDTDIDDNIIDITSTIKEFSSLEYFDINSKLFFNNKYIINYSNLSQLRNTETNLKKTIEQTSILTFLMQEEYAVLLEDVLEITQISKKAMHNKNSFNIIKTRNNKNEIFCFELSKFIDSQDYLNVIVLKEKYKNNYIGFVVGKLTNLSFTRTDWLRNNYYNSNHNKQYIKELENEKIIILLNLIDIYNKEYKYILDDYFLKLSSETIMFS